MSPENDSGQDRAQLAPTLRDLVRFLKETEPPDDQFGKDLEAIQAEQPLVGDTHSA